MISQSTTVLPSPSDCLPHVAPFLFVDEVTEITKGQIIATRNIPEAEPWTEAHFPGQPIVPGVILLEGLAQTCGILLRDKVRAMSSVFNGYLTEIKTARFNSIVIPGERIEYRCRLLAQVGQFYRFSGSVSVGNVEAASAEITLYLHLDNPSRVGSGV